MRWGQDHSILVMRKLRHREVNQPAQGHTASQWGARIGTCVWLHFSPLHCRDQRHPGHRAEWTESQLATRALLRHVWERPRSVPLGSPVLREVCLCLEGPGLSWAETRLSCKCPSLILAPAHTATVIKFTHPRLLFSTPSRPWRGPQPPHPRVAILWMKAGVPASLQIELVLVPQIPLPSTQALRRDSQAGQHLLNAHPDFSQNYYQFSVRSEN